MPACQVVSGFHALMEKECLDLLLRGTQPIVICPLASIEGNGDTNCPD